MPESEALRVRRMFDGGRVRVAREFQGWSRAELARRTEKLSGAAVGQFESGEATPNTDNLERLADALEVPVSFFARTAATGSYPGAYFRSLRSTTLTERRKARAFVQYVHQFARSLEQVVELPESALGRHPVAHEADRAEIDGIASATRKAWGLEPLGPLPNVVRLLERHGIVVVRNYASGRKVDAYSVPFGDRSVIVLSAEKGKYDRSRFDAAHELAHLVMHKPGEDAIKPLEEQAHQFAAAFLMPAEGIAGELPSWADWPVLLDLKEKWGVSVAALLRRGLDLKRMSPDEYTRSMKALSARGWRKDEPGNVAPEEPVLLRRAVQVVLEAQNLTLDNLAERAALPIEFVKQLTHASGGRPSVII